MHSIKKNTKSGNQIALPPLQNNAYIIRINKPLGKYCRWLCLFNWEKQWSWSQLKHPALMHNKYRMENTTSERTVISNACSVSHLWEAARVWNHQTGDVSGKARWQCLAALRWSHLVQQHLSRTPYKERQKIWATKATHHLAGCWEASRYNDYRSHHCNGFQSTSTIQLDISRGESVKLQNDINKSCLY